MRVLGYCHLGGRLGEMAQLAPSAEPPFFFSQIGKTFPAEGERGIAWRSSRDASPT
jgi:glycolate oxidase iron-sulfur subunit